MDDTDKSTSVSSTVDDDIKRRMPSSPLGWPMAKIDNPQPLEHTPSRKQSMITSEIEMMKERFSKLLLGEDMSGSGKGVCPALAISNAITNLCASVFGQLWRLKPLPAEKKAMWRREMDYLLSVMTCTPRSDLFINLPALQKLDNLLIELLDGFKETESWYVVDQRIVPPDTGASFKKLSQRQEKKWWLPVPRVPLTGLNEASRKQLNHKRECANQILKATLTINSNALMEMEVPESYLDSLRRACLGDVIYRYNTSDQFSAEWLLDCLDLSDEHVVVEMANRVEAAVFVWKKRSHSKQVTNSNQSATKSSWEMVKDFIANGEKRVLLAERAEGLLISLKQRYPNLSQTTLDDSKIQNNKDVGRSILESYSRVFESLAFNTVPRIDNVLYVDDLANQCDKLPSGSTESITSQKRLSISLSMCCLGTPHRTTLTTPSFSPARSLVSPSRGEQTPFLNTINHLNKPHSRGLGVKKVLSGYLSNESRGNNYSNQNDEQPQSVTKAVKKIEAPTRALISVENRKSGLEANLHR